MRGGAVLSTIWDRIRSPCREENWRMDDERSVGACAAETIRRPRDRLKGQPQERQHSAAAGGTRNRLPPARGTIWKRDGARPKAETHSGSVHESPTGAAGLAMSAAFCTNVEVLGSRSYCGTIRSLIVMMTPVPPDSLMQA